MSSTLLLTFKGIANSADTSHSIIESASSTAKAGDKIVQIVTLIDINGSIGQGSDATERFAPVIPDDGVIIQRHTL